MEEPWTAITISVGNESHKAGPVPSIHGMRHVTQMKETACTPSPTCASPLTVQSHSMSRICLTSQIVDNDDDYNKSLL